MQTPFTNPEASLLTKYNNVPINSSASPNLPIGVLFNIFKPESNTDKIMIFFWSSISGIIRMAEYKKAYYKLLGFDNDEFVKQEFLALLGCCQNMQEETL